MTAFKFMHPFPLLMFVNNDQEYGACAPLRLDIYVAYGINRVGGLTHLYHTFKGYFHLIWFY